MITLSNNILSIKINEKGAELSSIQCNGIEYLWQADAAFWAKHSPVLFPIVGELKDGVYIFDNKEYALSRHGFARDKIFEALQSDNEAAIFILRSDEDTLKVYPFKFIFKVIYKLDVARLSCTYSVENVDNKNMYFSVGGHPAFNVPLNKQLPYTDYYLYFNNDTTLNRYVLQNGLTGNDTELILLTNNELLLQPSLFYKDAIVLKNIASTEIILKSDKDAHGLILNFKGFPYFGIWAAKDAPFLCLEPWCGIAYNINHDKNLINKEGINQLHAGEGWQRTWSIEMF